MTTTITIEITEAEGDFMLAALAHYQPEGQDAMALAVDGKVDAAICKAFYPHCDGEAGAYEQDGYLDFA